MILEGAMIILACLVLTAFHPGVTFAGEWRQANFTLRQRKESQLLHAGSQDIGMPDGTKGVRMATFQV